MLFKDLRCRIPQATLSFLLSKNVSPCLEIVAGINGFKLDVTFSSKITLSLWMNLDLIHNIVMSFYDIQICCSRLFLHFACDKTDQYLRSTVLYYNNTTRKNRNQFPEIVSTCANINSLWKIGRVWGTILLLPALISAFVIWFLSHEGISCHHLTIYFWSDIKWWERLVICKCYFAHLSLTTVHDNPWWTMPQI